MYSDVTQTGTHTEKSTVFSLGLLFFTVITGTEHPLMDFERDQGVVPFHNDPVFDQFEEPLETCLIDGVDAIPALQGIYIRHTYTRMMCESIKRLDISKELKDLLIAMLGKDPANRLFLYQVHSILGDLINPKEASATALSGKRALSVDQTNDVGPADASHDPNSQSPGEGGAASKKPRIALGNIEPAAHNVNGESSNNA